MLFTFHVDNGFIYSLGMISNNGYSVDLGIGVRPVITINASEI